MALRIDHRQNLGRVYSQKHSIVLVDDGRKHHGERAEFEVSVELSERQGGLLLQHHQPIGKFFKYLYQEPAEGPGRAEKVRGHQK